jgi:hypothetical protein
MGDSGRDCPADACPFYPSYASTGQWFVDDPARAPGLSVTWVGQTSYVLPYAAGAAFTIEWGYTMSNGALSYIPPALATPWAFPAAANIVSTTMVASMTRAITVCATVLAICLATSNSAQDLAPEKIVSVGQNTYKIRVVGKLVDLSDKRAMKRASEFCTEMKKTMVVNDKTWDLGYGYTLTWSCLPPQNAPIDH